jgi:hypothetical protein
MISIRCLTSPDWVWQSRKPVDRERLYCQQHDGNFDDWQIVRVRENSKRNDHGGRAGRRMIDVREHHDSPGKRES